MRPLRPGPSLSEGLVMHSKILIVSGAASSMVRFRSAFLAALIANGHDVVAVVPTDEPDWVERLKASGVTVIPYAMNRTGVNPFADLLVLFRLREIIRRERPDRILAYSHKPVLYGLAVSGGRPFFGILTGLGYVFTGNGWKQRLIRIVFRCVYPPLLRRASALLFLNADDAEVFARGGLSCLGLNVGIIPGEGVDPVRFPATPPPAAPVRFLMLARLLRDKGVREYAAAARRVKALYPEIEFHLAGGADSNPTAIPVAEVKGWEREGILTYHGEVTDVRPLIAETSVYVLPSYREGMPVSVMEAMSMGRPIIVTDVPGCRAAVRDGDNGLLVPPADASALAEAMLRLIDRPDERLRMGARSRQRIESEFSQRTVNARLFTFLGLEAAS